MTHHFQWFTKKYALSKTLRFELKPYNQHVTNYLKANQVLEKDEDIEKSYQILKPVMDQIHEKFINESLESQTAKKISFSEYIEIYKAEKKEEKTKKDEEIKKILSTLRWNFWGCFEQIAEKWKIQIWKNEKWKDILSEKGYKMLTEAGILEYIKKNIWEFTDKNTTEDEIKWALSKFERFFTYFSGFNQNRENYYETKDEKSTAIATRIIHVNLPKFCDNSLAFEKRREEYLKVYDSIDKTKQIKDAQSGEMIPIYSIDEKYFQSTYFNSCLSQNEIEDYNKIIGHYNGIINLYNQQQSEKWKKLSLFKTLYKQIGCGKKKAFMFQITHDFEKDTENKKQSQPEAISVQEILKLVEKYGEKYLIWLHSYESQNLSVNYFITDLRTRTDWTGYYWSKAAFNTLSNWYFANWQDLAVKLIKSKENPNGIFEKADKKKELETGEKVKIPDTISLEKLFSHIDKNFSNWKVGFFKERILEKRDWEDEKDKIDTEKKEIFDTSKTPSETLIKLLCLDIEREILAWEEEKNKVLSITDFKLEKSKELIKTWMDHTVNIFRMVKYFSVPEWKIKDGGHLDPALTEILKALLEPEDAQWFKWYDGLRNYLTKKAWEEEKENKLKLNFENSTLAGGWDVNKETANTCVIIQDNNGKKYLAVTLKKTNTVFEETIREWKVKQENPIYEIDNEWWKKMEYKLLPWPNKMLPKCLLPKSEREKYGASDEILNIYDSWAFKKSEATFDKNKMHQLINFYKEALPKYEDWKVFNFTFKETKEYEDISQFYKDVEIQGYKLTLKDINKNILEQLIEQWKIYLFEIKNQDSNEGKKENHKQNLHTIYWNAIFSDIENKPKLNGEAELFYRKAVDSEILEKEWKGKKILKNFRFSREKYLFHVPITLNFCLDDEYINSTVEEYIQNQEVTYLWLDRGEKHLVYFSLINKDGKIIKQGSLNLPFTDKDGNLRTIQREVIDENGNKQIKNCKDYNEVLDTIAWNRDYARKNWQKIGNIKEMKEGYISQVVHEIVKLALENNALIVMEDLNTGFKRGRQKIEKSIYQKFELALAKKLNFIVDKSKDLGDIGSVTNALQLTPPVQNYWDIEWKKQVGIILYTRANYTSQTDPATGWRKSIYLQKWAKEIIRSQIENFKEIGYDNSKKAYYFTYSNWDFLKESDRKLLNDSQKQLSQKEWTVWSCVDRYKWEKNAQWIWEVKPVNVTQNLDKIFEVFDKQRSIKEQLIEEAVEIKKYDSKYTEWENLLYAINMIFQIRNTSDTGEDFLHSPVFDEKWEQFDSRKWLQKNNNSESENILPMPLSWDANWAYNIARKGILMAEHIKTNTDTKDVSLFISDEEWSMYLTDKIKWKSELPRYSSRKAMEKEKK